MISKIAKISGFITALILIIGISAYFTLTLIIKSEDTVIVPELVGKNVVNALEILTDLKLNTKIRGSEYNLDIPAEHVIFQEPEPGSEIKIGRDVRIIVSKGTKTILMPNLKGLSIEQAKIILEENGLYSGKISTVYDNRTAKNEIVAQSVPSDNIIMPGEHVNLLVSKGKRPDAYKMIDLKGLALGDAIFLIEKSNLLLGEIRFRPYEDKPKNVVVAQEPLSGYRVLQGSSVNIVINRQQNGMQQNDLHAEKGTGVFRYRLSSGFLKKHILIRLKISGFSLDFFDDFVEPDKEILLMVPQNNNSTIFLYENNKLIKTQIFDSW